MNELAGITVAMFTTGHLPDDDRIYYKEIKSLAKFGAKIKYIYPNLKKAPSADEANIAFCPFAAQRGLKYRLQHGRQILAVLLTQQFDVIHCHEPDALYWALQAKKQWPAIKIIYDSHEMWGAVFAMRFKRWLWDMAQPVYNFNESLLLAHCDGAIGASTAISEYLRKKVPQTVTLFNAPLTGTFPELQPAALTTGPVVLIHDGHLTFDRGLRTMAEAVLKISQQYDIIFKIVGDTFDESNDWLNNFIVAHGLEKRIIKTGWLPYEAVGAAIATGHIGLNGHTVNPNNAICAPNKCFNYMYYGLAQVGANLPRSQYRILADEGAALLYEPDNSDDMANVLAKYLGNRSLLDKQRMRAWELSHSKYRWEHMEPILLGLYQKVLETNHG